MASLPLLDFVNKEFPNLDLKDILLIGCQHILPSNGSMFNYLFRKGLKVENTFLIGKAYSTNRKTQISLGQRGLHVHKYDYSSHKSFETQFVNEIKTFISEVVRKAKALDFTKILVLDDGGVLIKEVNISRPFPSFQITCIEQTTSGYERLKSVKLHYPVLNVARSPAKLNTESPFIARVMIDEMKRRLKRLRISPKKILVVGAGAIGLSLFEQLGKDYNTGLYDISPKKSHFDGNLESIASNYDVIVGSTGATILTRDQLKTLKRNVVLLSASSSDIEFDSASFRKLVKETDNPHLDITVDRVQLLNSGFPINFTGSELERLSDIQLTRALMFSATCIAANHAFREGLIDLGIDVQKKIVKEFNRIQT